MKTPPPPGKSSVPAGTDPLVALTAKFKFNYFRGVLGGRLKTPFLQRFNRGIHQHGTSTNDFCSGHVTVGRYRGLNLYFSCHLQPPGKRRVVRSSACTNLSFGGFGRIVLSGYFSYNRERS